MKVVTAHPDRIRHFFLGRMMRAERGASLVEYAILVAVMAGIVFVTVTLLGARISTFVDSLNFLD